MKRIEIYNQPIWTWLSSKQDIWGHLSLMHQTLALYAWPHPIRWWRKIWSCHSFSPQLPSLPFLGSVLQQLTLHSSFFLALPYPDRGSSCYLRTTINLDLWQKQPPTMVHSPASHPASTPCYSLVPKMCESRVSITLGTRAAMPSRSTEAVVPNHGFSRQPRFADPWPFASHLSPPHTLTE